MTNSVELVLFYGPPFIGKTLHYFNHYSKTHTRISASEIFKEDKCSNLRLVILKVIGLLNEGKNVVIDDENWYIATRQSYISLVKKKVPICTFTIVQFLTDITSGYQQCLWAREWALVEQTLLENKDYNSTLLTESVEKLDCWFARKRSELNPPELPATAEGFSIVTVNPQLICGTSYKFNLPALFIQWQSILTDAQNENLNCKSTAPDVLNKWLEKNPSGRILIIGPKTKNDKDIIEEQTKTLLLLLSSQLTCPLYFTFIDEKHQLDHYSQLPQPGVLAFLQKLHRVNLYHKGTIYMYSSDEHYRAASSVGIRTIKAAKLFDHPHLIDSVYCGETMSTLSFLQNMLQVTCSTSCKETRESVDEIPFFSRARKSSTPLVWKYCHGKVTGVCFKDKLALERYQTHYKLAARTAKPPGKIKRGTSRTEYVSSTLPSSERSLPSSEQSLRALVGNINLREVAETPGRYHGGFQCRDSVFDMNVEVLEQRLKITCKCTGSSRQPYDVQVMLSDSSGLLEAHCSCPDVAGKTGRCKHVIGLLLNYKNHQTPSA
ncbi:deoxyribonuclease TATDN2, partial [Paramuricea clavata]